VSIKHAPLKDSGRPAAWKARKVLFWNATLALNLVNKHYQHHKNHLRELLKFRSILVAVAVAVAFVLFHDYVYLYGHTPLSENEVGVSGWNPFIFFFVAWFGFACASVVK